MIENSNNENLNSGPGHRDFWNVRWKHEMNLRTQTLILEIK